MVFNFVALRIRNSDGAAVRALMMITMMNDDDRTSVTKHI